MTVKTSFSGNDISSSFSQPSMYSYGQIAFCKNKTSLLNISLLNIMVRKYKYWLIASLRFLQFFFGNSYWNISISIKSSLRLVYSRQRSQSLHLIPHVQYFFDRVPIEFFLCDFLQQNHQQGLIISLP